MQNKVFVKSATIQEMEVDRDFVNLRIRFSSEVRDKQGDLFLKSAWTQPEDVAYFLKKGKIDWNHLSKATRFLKAGASVVERAEAERIASQAVLGIPKGKGIWIEGDQAVCDTRINAKNPYISAYIPLIKEGYQGLEASAAGGAFDPKPETIAKFGENTYDRAILDHIAICPAAEGVNPKTEIELIKSSLAESLGFGKQQKTEKENQTGEAITLEHTIAEFMKSQPNYKTWVAERLVDSIESGQIAKRFAPIHSFLKSHGLSDEDSEKHTVHLLHLLNS